MKTLVKASAVFVGLATCNLASAELTTEQMQQLIQMQQQLLQMQRGGAMGGAAQQPILAPMANGVIISEDTMGKKVQAFSKSKGGIAVERFKDGFAIDGVRYVDPEGEIDRYAFDALTGDITYLVRIMPGQYKVKTTRARADVESVTLATATHASGTWQVQTLTGKSLTGRRILPLSRGLLVARDNVAFKYIPGKGVTNIVGPEDFAIAGFQNGDIEGTGYMLMERMLDPARTRADDLVGGLKALGSLLGAGKKEDYLLLEMSTGKRVPVNVSLEGKDVQIMSRCRQKNFWVSICDKLDSYESLYDPKTGTPNLSHYYWRISWYKTAEGPVLVSQEGGLSEINATNLMTGKQVNLFSRALGIAGFAANQGADGKVSVIARMGFSKETVDDVVVFMNKAPVKQEEPKQAQDSAKSAGATTENLFGL